MRSLPVGRASRALGIRPRRGRLASIDWQLWGIPLAMVGLSGVLIASTQRQADYADWYQHWISAGVGLLLALALARLPLERLNRLRWPI